MFLSHVHTYALCMCTALGCDLGWLIIFSLDLDRQGNRVTDRATECDKGSWRQTGRERRGEMPRERRAAVFVVELIVVVFWTAAAL